MVPLKRITSYGLLFLAYGMYMAADTFSKPLLMLVATVAFAYFYYSQAWQPRWIRFLCLLSVSVPVSFLGINGASYGDVPFSWFNLFQLFFVVEGILSSRPKLSRLALGSLAFCVMLVPALMQSPDVIVGCKQYIHIVVTTVCIIVFTGRIRDVSADQMRTIVRTYVAAAVLMAFLVMLQGALLYSIGLQIGVQMEVGSNRQILSASFSDPSFLSLYLDTALVLVMFETRLKLSPVVVSTAVALAAGAVLCSARTGVAALAGAIVVYVTLRVALTGRIQWKLLLISVVVVGVSLAGLMMERSDIAGDSRRFESYIKGLAQFSSSPFVGMGLGVTTYKEITGETIPHNLVVQYLAQSGLIGITGLAYFAFECMRSSFKAEPKLFTALVSCFIGSFFVPDMINSRFFLVIVLIVIGSVKAHRDAHRPAPNYA